jgi:hypothetical protein
MNTRIISILMALALGLMACSLSFNLPGFSTVRGSGNVVTEGRPVSGFTSVDFSGIGEITVQIGDEEALRIEAEDNLLEYLETEVRDSALIIGIRDRVNLVPDEPIKFYLTVKSLEGISISGLGKVEAPALTAERFSVEISGSGNMSIESLEAASLNVDISGLGGLEVGGGSVDELNIDISGSGNYEGRNLEGKRAAVSLSGLGSATLWAIETLDVQISGAGSVSYAGQPRVSSEISGAGSLESIGE